MPVITPNIPEGLIELMKTFAKCVLKEKPENIYEFSVVHFEKLLQERDGDLNKGYERFAASEKYLEAREKCLMSQITSHLNKKSRPDPIKIPPYDDAEDISLSETLSPNSLQHKFRPRKLSSRKASEVLLSIKEEDEGHNPSEELALQHGKLTAARRIQRAYKSYRKRREERENGAALVIQRTLKKLFGSKLGGVKVLHNDGESTCSNIQNDSGVESDVPKDETEGEQENHKELNVCDEKYMNSHLGINSIITQQVPSFTEDECKSQNLEPDKVEKSSVGNVDEADTVDLKEKSVDDESSVHKGSQIESSACKQLDIEETQLNGESERTEDLAEVGAANLKLDHNHTTDEVVKAEILKDVEEPLKTGAAEAGKSILEREGRFVSNDTNNIGSAELASDVQNKKSDDIENKGNGFPEAILEEVARNGSKNDISKETIEFAKSPRENENGKQNSEENINNDKNDDKIEIQTKLNNEDNDKKQEENESSSQNRNDAEENQSQLNLTENEKEFEGNKKTQSELIMNDEAKSENAQKINSDKHLHINEIKNGNEENKDEDSNPSLKKDEDSVTPKSVWYVGSEPIITSKSIEEKDDSNSLENISTISNEKSEPEKMEQDNNSTINENSKTIAVNEKIESNSTDINQGTLNINTENETPIEKCEAEAENIETCNKPNKNEENEISSKEVECDKNVVDVYTNGIKNGEIIIKNHTEADADLAIPETTASVVEKLENDDEEKGEDVVEIHNEENSEHKEGIESVKDKILSEGTERSIENVENEGEKEGEISEKKISESSVEKLINDEKLENTGPDKNVVNEDPIGMQNEEISVSKQVEGDEENQTVSETGMDTENLKKEQEISSAVTGSDKDKKDAVEIQNEEISGRKNSESSEDEKDKNLKETNENNIENIKNDEHKEEEKGRTVSSYSNSAEKEETSVHNNEINGSEADDGDKNNDIPKLTENSTDIFKNAGEKEETLSKNSLEEVRESTDAPEIEEDNDEKKIENNENLKELEKEVETEKYVDETKDGKGNEGNTHNNVMLNEENFLSGKNKNEGEVDSQNEASKVLSGNYEDGININKAEVIEEEIKKVVAPSRYASPGKISSTIGKENNPVEKNLASFEDKIIAKELLQHASVKDVDILLKEEQNKSEEQIAHDAKTAELETKLTNSNSKNLISNHLEDDGILDSEGPELNTSNEYNKSDEDKNKSKRLISSKKNSKAEIDEAKIKKLESQSINSESQKIEPNEEELNVTKENTAGIAEKNLNDQILESTQMDKNENLRFDLKDDKEQKKKEERAFEGFIVEPAFKENDGGNTGINPEENVKKDSTETSEAGAITEQKEDIPQLNALELQGPKAPKDDKQNDTNSEDKKEFVEDSQENQKYENCDEKGLNIDLSKEENISENKNEDKKENNLFLTQVEQKNDNNNFVDSVSENNTINNSESADTNELTNKLNNINQEQGEDVDEGQTALQKYPEKIVRGESAENNDVKNESDLKISHDNKEGSLNFEENKAGSPTPDNELNNNDNQTDEANISQQIEEKEANQPPNEKIDDTEYRKKEVNAANNLTTDHKLPRDGKEEGSLKEEEREESLKDNDEHNFENTKEVVKPSNEEDQQKTVQRTEFEKPVEKFELKKLNADQKSENLRELNENTGGKEVSDEEDTEFSQDTVEETQPSVLIKSAFEENPKHNVDVEVETKDSENETKTTHNLEKPPEETETIENPLTKIDDSGDIFVGNLKENSEEFHKDIADIVNKDEEKGEDKDLTIKDKEDNRKNSSDLFQLNVKNSINGTGGGSGVETNMENHEIQSNPEETKNEDNYNKEQSQSKITNQESIIDEIGAVSTEPTEFQIDETKNDLDDETKKQNSVDANKSTEQALMIEKDDNKEDKIIYKNEKLENSDGSDHEKQNIEKNFSFSENALKDVEKEEDTKKSKKDEDEDINANNKEKEVEKEEHSKNSKKDEDEDTNANNKENEMEKEEDIKNSKKDEDEDKNANNKEKEVEKEEDSRNSKKYEDEDTNANNKEKKEQTDNNTQLNKTYTISKNKPEETHDYNKENHILEAQISSSSFLLNALSNEPPADNELLSQNSTEKDQGEEMVEVQEEPTVKQIISQTETSKVQSAHLSDIEINKEQQNFATLNRQSKQINEDSTEKFVNKEIKAEINEEPTAKQFATTTEIHSAPLSDAETTRVESRSTINDELSEIENIDISTYGEDSLEAMYYSLRKNEIMLDRMQKRAFERKSASKERGPIEKLDLRQVKSMSEMNRSMSINSDDDVVIKTLEKNRSNDNDFQQFNNPISVVAQNTARLLESMHQMNSNPARPLSSSFEEERVIRQPCRIYSPSIRMKSRIPTPIKDFPKSVSFETPLAAVQRKSQKFMQLLHNDTQSSETVDSLLDQKETSDTIRQKMLAYSVSEADSDYCAEAEKKMSVKHDDSNVSTALETASTDTDSTIVSAATKIQAGARGFLTRRRLRRASDGALPQGSERKASFGNEAIGESLEDLVEQNAASKIQKSYRRYLGNKQHKSESSKPSPETSSSSKSSDGSKPVGITQVKIGQKRDRDETDDAKKADDIDDGYHGAYFEGLNLAERRLTLQRGDAVQKYSTPEEENGFSLTNGRQVGDAGDSEPTTSPKKRKPVKNDMWRNFGLRQRTMPVQIDSDILRIVPKHMRKRIKSADAQKKSRQVMQ